MFSTSINCYDVCGSIITEGIKPQLTGDLQGRSGNLLSLAHGKTSKTPIYTARQPSERQLREIFSEGIRKAEFSFENNQLNLFDEDPSDNDSVYVHVKSLFIGDHLQSFGLNETSKRPGKLKILVSTQVENNQNDWSPRPWPIGECLASQSSVTPDEKEYLNNHFAYFFEARPGARFQTIERTGYEIMTEVIVNNFVVTKSGRLKFVSSSATTYPGNP